MADLGILAIVPARNEEATVTDVVVDLISTIPLIDVLVVNDGSDDRTALMARAAGARVLDLPFKSGVGAAMRLGYRVAHQEGYAWTIRVDADGQHTAAAAAAVLALAQRDGLELAIGTRSNDDLTMPRAISPRRWAMRILAAWVSHTAGVRVPDATSGLRATSATCTAFFAQDYPSEFMGDTVEPIALAARAGLRVGTCPVEMLPRSAGRSSHGTLTSTFHVARSLIAMTIAGPGSVRPPA